MPPAVPPHPDDDRAEAGSGVEPDVEHDELTDRSPPLKEDEAEGGDEERAAAPAPRFNGCST